MRGLNWKRRDEGKPDVNFFENPKYCLMKATLDSRMKQLQGTGAFQPRQAEVISPDYEDLLWKEGLLGDHSPQVLVDTLVFYFGMYFALRSGQDHRRLRPHPSQIQLFEPRGGTPYLRYQEDVSKTNQGGLQHRKCQRKEVIHYANEENSERCIVRLYKLYQSLCPIDRPNGAFYLKPLDNPKAGVWFSKTAIGHNTLAKTIKRLCEVAGIKGYFTNHSLRACTATRLFEAGVDEQLIMQRTGHRSVKGVRSYKRMTDSLRKQTSDVLNSSTNLQAKKPKLDVLKVEPVASGDENAPPASDRTGVTSSAPILNFSGASNFTINFGV